MGATPEMLLAQGYQQVGKDFPVFLSILKTMKNMHLLVQNENQVKVTPDLFGDFSDEITLEQDLIRRDLTINAIAQDKDGKLHDPYHGVGGYSSTYFTSYFTCFC